MKLTEREASMVLSNWWRVTGVWEACPVGAIVPAGGIVAKQLLETAGALGANAIGPDEVAACITVRRGRR